LSSTTDQPPPANPALRVAAAGLRADPESVLAAAAVLEAMRFSSMLVPASTGDGSEVKFIEGSEAGGRILPVFSDAERHQAWPLHDGLGAVVLEFEPLLALLVDVGATSIYLDPDADATVTIDAAALLALRPDELSQGE
jgi:hypothetical protein